MPYKLDDFPIETSEPKLEVELPEGKHTFVLVVEDSAGRKSLAQSVTIEVKKEPIPKPVVDKIEPDFITPGKDKEVTIFGKNLGSIHAVRFFYGDRVEPRVSAKLREDGVTDEQVLITTTADEKAPVKESYTVEVETQSGTARLPASFKVVPAPKIKDFAPQRMAMGDDARMLIEGAHLLMQDHVLGKHAIVEFIREDTNQQELVDQGIHATIEPDSTSDLLVVTVSFDKEQDKVALGPRKLRVTTPAGYGEAKEPLEVTNA